MRKIEAIQLINEAVKAGFKRSVSKCGGEEGKKPFAVSVSLIAEAADPNYPDCYMLRRHAHIIVTFRTYRRGYFTARKAKSSVCVFSRVDGREASKQAWRAHSAIQHIKGETSVDRYIAEKHKAAATAGAAAI